jgi:carboxypeptidase PM20D1
LVATALIRTELYRAREAAPTSAGPIAIDEDQAARQLAGAIAIETISHTVATDHETAQVARLREYLGNTFNRVRTRLRWEEPGGNLLITWAGRDPGLEPLVLIAHMDVVPAVATEAEGAPEPALANDGSESEPWEKLAFHADLEKTRPFIYGRGSLDDKASVVGILAAVDHLLAEGFEPERSLLIALGQDEEVGGQRGAITLAALLEQRGLRPACVIDEGSFVLDGFVPGLDLTLAPIGVAEKGYLDIELFVRAPGGHSSMPPEHTAIGILANAIARLEENPFPGRIDGVTAQTVGALGPELPFFPRLLLVNQWLFGGLLRYGLAKTPSTNAQIRTTAAVTIVHGGIKDNVLPANASAIVNLRLLPGDTSQFALEHIRQAVGDPRVKVELADAVKYSSVHEASRISPSNSPAYRTLATTIRQSFSGAIAAPYLVVGGTDARHYERLTENIYRFLPIRLEGSDLGRLHAAYERISRRGFADVIRFYCRLIKNFEPANQRTPGVKTGPAAGT